MRSVALALTPLWGLSLCAQITIGPEDMPSAGDTMRYRSTQASAIDLTLTGADVVWDYAALVPGNEGADTAVSVGSTPAAYQFFFNNNVVFPQHRADYAVKGVGFGFQQVSFEDVYDYYKKSSTGFRNVGFGANINGIPASVRRVPVDFIHRFPMNFDDRDTSISAFAVDLPTLGYYGQDQVRINHVDGWGTIHLPGYSFEVLRVRSVLQQRDTLYVDQFGFGFGINRPQTVEYRWVAKGMDAPVLIVTTIGGNATSARFLHESILATVPGGKPAEDLRLWPNPAQNSVQLLLPDVQEARLIVRDLQGREVWAEPNVRGGAPYQWSVQGWAAGTYVVELVAVDGTRRTAPFVVTE